ncbi:MAG TPA: DUF4097 family beta strand repeat-containing protein [Alphaproteobacteria bacterium]|nr:DUF4097 family beta strand repeat-containing protein [Alphaproteobacteria bacterium]
MIKLTKAASMILLLAIAGCFHWDQEEGSFQRTLPVTGPVELDVFSGAGNITVHAGSDSAVYISARIQAHDSWSSMRAEEKVRKLEANPPIVQRGNRIEIGRSGDRELLNNVAIHYDLTVPAQTRLTTMTGAGSQRISGLKLPVDARTGAGRVEADDVTGNMELHSGAGNIRFTDPKGTVYAESGAGSVTAEGEPKQDWQIHVGAGSIRVQVPKKAAFTVYASSGFGRVRISPDLAVDGTVSHSSVQGRVGGGGPTLRLASGAGSITVE